MRGTRVAKIWILRAEGIIPAHAGNTTAYGKTDETDVGSSPRMRGTQHTFPSTDCSRGIIPAHAGNTALTSSRRMSAWDHPRACGEHFILIVTVFKSSGSSPRMRGTPLESRQNRRQAGIIPAHAGNTLRRRVSVRAVRDHPRACGEHRPRAPSRRDNPGSSPRMRGTR